jgi:hypothetical protein
MGDLFAPTGDDTAFIDVGAASARVKLGDIGGRIQVRVMNNGTATVWIKFGDITVTADTTNDIPIGPGYTGGFTVPPVAGGALYVAAIAAGATGKIYFTPGTGI